MYTDAEVNVDFTGEEKNLPANKREKMRMKEKNIFAESLYLPPRPRSADTPPKQGGELLLKIKGTTGPAKRQSHQMSEMKKQKSTKKPAARSSKEDLKGLLTTKLALTRQQFRTIRELYFEHSPDQINKVLRAAQRMGVPDLGNSDLVGNWRRGVRGLINRYRWDEKRHAIEQRLRGEETITGEGDAVSGVGDKSVPAPAISFPEWLEWQAPNWTWKWRYQRFIYKKLDRVVKGQSKRLMIFLPPRHGKSELVTVRFAAWMLAMRPEMRIIIGSYNQKLANKFSRKIRRIHLDQKTQEKEPPGGLLQTTDDWETAAGGGVKAVGVGSGVTGFGADLIIIDDPIRGRADANSENNRERVAEWYNDDLQTRLEPGGSIILIQTRWHEDDLAGRLLKDAEEGGEKWEVIRLPALAEEYFPAETQRCGEENADGNAGAVSCMDAAGCAGVHAASGVGDKSVPSPRVGDKSVPAPCKDPLGRKVGEALCPARFSREELLRKKAKMGSSSFEALYQQNPVPAGGGIFKVDWFNKRVDRMPPGLKCFRGYDLAVSTKTTADYTASVLCALDAEGNLYIADGFRKRIEYPEQRRFIIDRMQAEPDAEHGIEEAMHGKAIVQDLRRERFLARAVFRGVKVTTDKVTRASAWAARAEEGKVILVRGPWIAEFLEELSRFPTGRHDDQIDAVSIAVQMIDRPKYKHAGF